MSVDRLERVNVLLQREIAQAIPVVMSASGVDIASVTVTKVAVASNLRNATVSISVFGHEKERGTILSAFNSRKQEFQRIINRNIRLKYTPVLHFTLDVSLEKGDHVLDVLSKMEEAGEIPPEDEIIPDGEE